MLLGKVCKILYNYLYRYNSVSYKGMVYNILFKNIVSNFLKILMFNKI